MKKAKYRHEEFAQKKDGKSQKIYWLTLPWIASQSPVSIYQIFSTSQLLEKTEF